MSQKILRRTRHKTTKKAVTLVTSSLKCLLIFFLHSLRFFIYFVPENSYMDRKILINNILFHILLLVTVSCVCVRVHIMYVCVIVRGKIVIIKGNKGTIENYERHINEIIRQVLKWIEVRPIESNWWPDDLTKFKKQYPTTKESKLLAFTIIKTTIF